MTGKRHEETWRSNGNVLYFVIGFGYMDVYMSNFIYCYMSKVTDLCVHLLFHYDVPRFGFLCG